MTTPTEAPGAERFRRTRPRAPLPAPGVVVEPGHGLTWDVLHAMRGRHDVPPLRRLLLVVVASYETTRGGAFVSVETLREATGLSKDAIQGHLAELVATGWLTRTEVRIGSRTRHVYRVVTVPATGTVGDLGAVPATGTTTVPATGTAPSRWPGPNTTPRPEGSGVVSRPVGGSPGSPSSGAPSEIAERFVAACATADNGRRRPLPSGADVARALACFGGDAARLVAHYSTALADPVWRSRNLVTIAETYEARAAVAVNGSRRASRRASVRPKKNLSCVNFNNVVPGGR